MTDGGMYEFTRRLKQQAVELGFPLVGVTEATQPARLEHLWRWLDNGFAGSMQYMDQRRDAYCHPKNVLEGCTHLLMLGVPYLTGQDQKGAEIVRMGYAKIARYAQSGRDYHDVIRVRLKQLRRWFLSQVPSARVRGVVDTAPLLERDFAEAAGLGWVGKNTLLLNKQWGSYFFLAALLTDYPITPDTALGTSHCGTCRACLDNCPTQAFPEPFVLDATRCISYLTIEHGGPIEPQLAESIAGWGFGCDICQEVCPWNRRSLFSEDGTWLPQLEMQRLDILAILQSSEADFEQFRNTPLWRSGFTGMVRNAILVAGWQRMSDASRLIQWRLTSDHQVLRAAAAWALGRIGGEFAAVSLRSALATESADEVRGVIQEAIRSLELDDRQLADRRRSLPNNDRRAP